MFHLTIKNGTESTAFICPDCAINSFETNVIEFPLEADYSLLLKNLKHIYSNRHTLQKHLLTNLHRCNTHRIQ